MRPANPGARASRRQLALGSLAGVVSGSAWGAAIQALARPSSPAIALVGKGHTQIALLDTMATRVLIMLGPPDDDLIATIPAMMTLVRQRIDILIGSSPALDQLPADFVARWHVAHTFAIPDGETMRPDSGRHTSVTHDLRIDLGNGSLLVIRRSSRNAWRANGNSRALWAVSARCRGTTAVFAPDADSAEVLADHGAAVLVLPWGDIQRIANICSPSSIGVNDEHATDTHRGFALVRVFPADIARFTIEEGKISLPTWAVTPAD